MEDRLTLMRASKPIYDIVYRTDFSDLKAELQKSLDKSSKICIVTDSNVGPLYANEVLNSISDYFESVYIFTFEAGENSKNTKTVEGLLRSLVEHEFTRSDALIALGGGVVGDLTGFSASCYMRGIAFFQVPTSLLAMVDSSIGGKTGVDLDGYKNMVGAFYNPGLVYMNMSVLTTLDDRQFYAGFAEAMKSALIKDAKLYSDMVANSYEICDKDLEVLTDIIYRCNIIKKNVVEKDPHEMTGERALLNLGHTIGHAIEKEKGFELLHGECVALGCVAAAYISYKKELIPMEEYYEIRDMFVPFSLPISVDDLDIDKVCESVQHDKKRKGKTVNFVLLKKIGKAFVSSEVTKEEIRAAIDEINFTEEFDKE